MEQVPEVRRAGPSRGAIAIRFLYTLLFFLALGLVLTLIKLTTLFQYILLFFGGGHNEPVRRFANQLCRYAYEVMRYLTLNVNERPYPFRDFPEDLTPPAPEVKFE